MHPEMIKASLRIAKTSPSFIAVEQGVTRQMVSNVISGRSRSARIEERISQILGKPVDQIWPDRHEPLPKAPAVASPDMNTAAALSKKMPVQRVASV